MRKEVTSSLLLVFMLTAVVIAIFLRPIYRIADRGAELNLSVIIPQAFEDWHEIAQGSALIVDPQQQATIKQIYTDTLSRTYVDSHGYMVMLSIAYGKDQSDKRQMHLPEICYPAQGFQLQKMHKSLLSVEKRLIPVTMVVATQGQRSEPVTYWTTVGNTVVQGGIQKKMVELRYSLNREIPDGLLFRVSSIDDNEERAFEHQHNFIRQVLMALEPNVRSRIAGDEL